VLQNALRWIEDLLYAACDGASRRFDDDAWPDRGEDALASPPSYAA
jgi:hypothetical protein